MSPLEYCCNAVITGPIPQHLCHFLVIDIFYNILNHFLQPYGVSAIYCTYIYCKFKFQTALLFLMFLGVLILFIAITHIQYIAEVHCIQAFSTTCWPNTILTSQGVPSPHVHISVKLPHLHPAHHHLGLNMLFMM